MRFRVTPVVLSILVLLLASCNMPVSPRTATPDLAATITAQAFALQSAASSATPPPVPNTGASATPSGTQVSVSSVTNCRTGPGQSYDLVFTANPGPSFQVIGKYTPANYWIINNPAGGACWLWGQYAVVSGDTASLPEYPAPAAPPKASKQPKATNTPSSAPSATSTSSSGGGVIKPPILTLVVPVAPNAPGNLTQSRTCSGGYRGSTPIWLEDITLTWQDSINEDGYRVYKNGGAISTLPQGSTSFQIELRYDQGTGGVLFDNFGVEAYNNAGASQRPSVDVPRCP